MSPLLHRARLLFVVACVGCADGADKEAQEVAPDPDESFEVFWARESEPYETAGGGAEWVGWMVDAVLSDVSEEHRTALESVDFNQSPDDLLDDPAVFATCTATYGMLLSLGLVSPDSADAKDVEPAVVRAWAKTIFAVGATALAPFVAIPA